VSAEAAPRQSCLDRIDREWVDITPVSARERHSLNRSDLSADRGLPALFEEQAARTPDKPAVAAADVVLSYAELNKRANRLAHFLIGLGAGPEQFVATALSSGAEMVVGLLAILKAGAAYLPVDQSYPAERIEYMLADAKPRFLLTTSAFASKLPPGGPPPIVMDQQTAGVIQRCSDKNPVDTERVDALRPQNPAYLIYTSGSTGRPKGVVVEHRAVADYLAWTTHAYDGPHGVSLLPTSPAFDLTVTGLYTPLAMGGCVLVLPLRRFSDEDLALLERFPCTFLKVTPSHLQVLNALPVDVSPSQELLLGGEALFGETVAAWRRAHPNAALINVYGPTEATVNCAEYRIPPGTALAAGPVPIGRPQGGAQLHVLDTDLQVVPGEETGELYIAGAGLARGYLGRPGATADRFIPCPFGAPGSRMYRTGDLVRQREDGHLVFVGRVDDQVKFRGYRIELGEIESALIQHPQVAQAVCLVRRSGTRSNLVAYVAERSGGVIDGADIRQYARQKLPEYMVPSAVVVRDRLPLTAHGKLDRQALQAEQVVGGENGEAE
jgi:amino acid adenylation domain-containing protein